MSVNRETVSESPGKKNIMTELFILVAIKNKEWLNFNPLDWRGDSTYRLKTNFKAL